MANLYQLQVNVFDWLAPMFIKVGLEPTENVTWENNNAVRPDLTHWVGLALIEVANTGRNEIKYQNNANDLTRVDEIVIKRSVVKLRINIYGCDCMTISNMVQQQIQMTDNIENMNGLGIGFIGISQTQDLSELQSGKFKERAMFDITFNHTDKMGDSNMVEPTPLIPCMPNVLPIDTSITTIGTVTVVGTDEETQEIIVNKTIIEPE